MSIKRSLLSLVVSVVVFTGCNNGSTVTVTQLSPGAECAAGGVKIETTGKDAQIICNGASGTNGTNGTNGTSGNTGANGAQTLLSETTLPQGDTHCPGGGTLVQSGLDNGGDGGVANDGILEPGEVTASTPVCNGDTGARPGSLTPPAGAAGTDTINLNGGVASVGIAGTGGSFYASINGGTNGGHVKAFTTGHVDATFTVPTPGPAVYGPVGLTLSADLEVPMADGLPSGFDAGTVFLVNNALGIAQDDGGVSYVTGLNVTAGTTVTLSSGFSMNNALTNAGTLKFPPGSEVSISCDQYVGAAGSKLLGRGVDGSGTTSATRGASLYLSTNSALINQGSADFSGGSGTDGAPGGYLQFNAYGKLYNTGNLVVLGGEGTTGNGASGGGLDLRANYGVYNSGALDVSGGRGAGSVGGSAGYVQLQLNQSGPVFNTGAISANGGDATQADGRAGNGGTIAMYPSAGSLLTSGALTAHGGAADVGGPGGSIHLEEQNGGSSPIYGSGLLPSGNVWVSGSLDASGGAGFNGGSGYSAPGHSGGTGGTIQVTLATSNPNGAELAFFGYASISANGASGETGGAGGQLRLMQGDDWSNTFGGAIINNVALSAAGGAGTTTALTDGGVPTGGNGGRIYLQTQQNYYSNSDSFEQVINTGNLDVSGATGNGGGSAGGVYIFGLEGVSTTSTLKASGGVGTLGTSGRGGDLEIAAQNGPTTLGGTVTATGASSTKGDGGKGGYLGLQGSVVHLTTAVDLHAGDGEPVAGSGGAGGYFEAWSLAGATDVSVTAPAGINVKPGTGFYAGRTGEVLVDGLVVTSNWTH
jgi:hypothetical protein